MGRIARGSSAVGGGSGRWLLAKEGAHDVKPDVPQIVSEACRATLLWTADGAAPTKKQWGQANAIAGRFVLFAMVCVRRWWKRYRVVCCGVDRYRRYVPMYALQGATATRKEARNGGIVWTVADSVCFLGRIG